MKKDNGDFRKKLYELDKFAVDGIYTALDADKEPKIKIRELIEYCKNKNIQSTELSQEEYEKFIIH